MSYATAMRFPLVPHSTVHRFEVIGVQHELMTDVHPFLQFHSIDLSSLSFLLPIFYRAAHVNIPDGALHRPNQLAKILYLTTETINSMWPMCV